MKSQTFTKPATVLLAIAIILPACSFQIDKTKATDSGASTESLNSFTAIKANILDARCARCHSGVSGKGDVDLSSYQAIMANPGLVEPGKPAASRLYVEVASGDMPEGGPPLSPKEVQAIESWITDGAVEINSISSSTEALVEEGADNE